VPESVEPQFMTVSQIAELFEVNVRSVNDWIAANKFPGAFKVPGGSKMPWMVPTSEVKKYKKERDQAAT